MVVILMHSGYQNQLDFTIEQAGIVFKFQDIVFAEQQCEWPQSNDEGWITKVAEVLDCESADVHG